MLKIDTKGWEDTLPFDIDGKLKSQKQAPIPREPTAPLQKQKRRKK